MTKEELRQKIDAETQRHNQSIKNIKIQYCNENNTVKIGDIVEDHFGKIKVEKIGYYLSDIPECFYSGIILNKNGSVTKKKDNKRKVYQSAATVHKIRANR